MKIRTQTVFLSWAFSLLGCSPWDRCLMVQLSHDVARANPTITYMRVPVLLIAWSILACVLAALTLAFLLLERIRKDNIFEPQSVRHLRAAEMCAFTAILPLIFCFSTPRPM